MKARLAAASLLFAFAEANAATPNHQYRLDGSLADDFGGPALASAGGVLDATGYSFGANQGLTLPVDLGTTYTIDLRFHFDDVNSGWNKIIDYKSLSSDSGMYTHNGAWWYCCGANSSNGPFNAVQDGVDARLTMTHSADGHVNIFINGLLNISLANDGGIGDFTGNSARFFIDDTVTNQNEARAGRVDFIRTFNSVLSANDVAALGNNPVSAVPESGTAALMLLGLAGLGVGVRAGRTQRAFSPAAC